MTDKKDVLIVGAGVIGCSIAYHLGKKGITSLIIDKNGIGDRASGKAWGVLSYPKSLLVREKEPLGFWITPEGQSFGQWLDLYESSFHRMADLALDIQERGGIDIEFGDIPLISLAFSEAEETYHKETLSLVRQRGDYKCKWLEQDEIKAIFPAISPNVRGGLMTPQLQVEPYKYTLGLAQSAESMGAEIRNGDVVGFETENGNINAVKLASGAVIEADKIVLAMGPWTTKAASWLGRDMPLSIIMEECICLEAPEDYPHYSLYGHIEIIRKVNGELILATAEVQSAQHYLESKARNDLDDRLTEEVKEKNLETAVRLLPDLEEARLVTHRGDLLAYGPAPDYHRPIMGRLPQWENGYVATGFGGLGINMSSTAGHVMADMIADGQVPFRYQSMMDHLSPK
jgi:glycine oxidase